MYLLYTIRESQDAEPRVAPRAGDPIGPCRSWGESLAQSKRRAFLFRPEPDS
jgi:hypothetical protein